MIRSGLIIMIKDLASKGKSAGEISLEVGVAENTARKYMTQPAKEHGLKGRKKVSKLDPYKPYLQELMNQGIFNCVVLLRRIREKGYEGSLTILKDYVHDFRPAKASPAAQRYETLPGKQAQMDWGMCPYTDAKGVLHHTPALAMILGHSRNKYVEFTSRCDLRSLQRCMVNAFEYFGGVPEIILTDNMKTVVDHREGKRIIWNPQFADFAVQMGFVPKVCRIRRPQTKGKVERLVRYVKDNFLPGRLFEDLEDLNRQVLQWCRDVDSIPHSTTGKIPLQELANEQLRPLPEQNIINLYRWESRKVTRDGFVSFDGIRYGVPWQYSGQEVQVRLHSGNVEIYKGESLLARHKAQHGGSRILWLRGQYKGLSSCHGIPGPYPGAHMTKPEVEQRDLLFYDRLLGGASNG